MPEMTDSLSTKQRKMALQILADGWYSIPDLTRMINARGLQSTENGIGARVRDLRKAKFGGFDIKKQFVKGSTRIYEYRLSIPQYVAPVQEKLFA